MPRGNGSYTGFDASPNANVASGIWTVREAETLLRADKWPATPTVPGAPSGTAGDEEVSLTWTAPTGGSTVTDYEVQYSSDAGSTWTTFSDGVSTATSATITGLTNGTGYIFRVRAINALGEGPYGSASGTITPAGIVASLLLNFNGNNGDTTTTDASSQSHTITLGGDATISTTQSKFGGSSGLFTLNGGILTIPYSASLEFGSSDDFTVEMWARFSSLSSFRDIAGTHAGGQPIGWLLQSDGTDLRFFTNASSTTSQNFGVTLSTGTWYHIAMSRESGTLRLFLDGDLKASATVSQSLESSVGFGIGRAGNIDGYLDDIRIIKGHALYTASFTPPSSQLTANV